MKKIISLSIFIMVILLSLTACTIIDEEPSNDLPTEEITGITFENQSFIYDGNQHSLAISGTLPLGVSVNYTNNNQVNVGEYEVTATFIDSTNKYKVPNPMKAKLTILPKEISEISFTGEEVVYDGHVHSLTISGTLPAGVTVIYENNDQINVGEYEVIAKFRDSTGNYNLPKQLSAILKITPKKIDWITFESKTYIYDGNIHRLAITGELPEGVIVEYINNDQINVGEYEVIAEFIDTTGNYIVPEPMSAEMIIYDDGSFIKVIFNYGDHQETINIKSGSILETVPEIPNRLGYKATWDFDFSLPIYFDLTCNINYDLLIYNINYVLPEGIENNPQNVTTYTYESDLIILYAAADIIGYHFEGWYADNTKIESIPAGSIGDITLYAKWEANNYTITYLTNGGTLALNTQIVTYDSAYELYDISRIGYSFIRYTKDGLEIAKTGIWQIAENVTIEAKWQANNYTITYLTNGGTLALDTQTVTYDSAYELYDISRIGYSFIRYTKDSLEIAKTGIWQFAENVTIEAKWQANNYTITYLTNGGTLVSDTQLVTYDSAYELYDISRIGYSFIRYTKDDLEIAKTGIWQIAEDVTIEAVWEINQYLISYYYNDKLLGTESVIFKAEFNLMDTVGDYYVEEWLFRDNTYSSGTTLIYDFDFDIELFAKDITYSGSDFILDITEETKTAAIMDYVGLETDLVIPNVIRYLDVNYTINEIGDRAFYACDSLISVIYRGNLLSIGNNSFAECENLESIIFDGIIETIGDSIFADCNKLKNVTISCDINEVNGNLFSGCISLETLTIMGKVEKIEAYAFSNFVNLKNIIVDGNIESIGALAFSTCRSLRSIVFGAEVGNIDSNAFYNCTSLESIIIAGNIGSIGEKAFSGCSNLASVTFNGNINSIVENVFYGCLSLANLTIGGNIESIGDSAFYHCTSLTELTFGGNVGSIGGSAFSTCSSLTRVFFGGNVEYIEKWAFSNCRSIESITITGQAGIIASEAFWNCSGLINFIVEKEVESVGEDAFSGCSSLSTITFGKDLRIIEQYAFNNCPNLESIIIRGNIESIGEWAFFGCFNLKNIVFGGKILSIGNGAFNDCSHIENIYFKGNYEDWQLITIAEQNEALAKATIYYYAEVQPQEDGNYWFYDEDNNVVIW